MTRLTLAITKKEGRVWIILQVLQRLNLFLTDTRQWDEDKSDLALWMRRGSFLITLVASNIRTEIPTISQS
jgi:hypothetical protein